MEGLYVPLKTAFISRTLGDPLVMSFTKGFPSFLSSQSLPHVPSRIRCRRVKLVTKKGWKCLNIVKHVYLFHGKTRILRIVNVTSCQWLTINGSLLNLLFLYTCNWVIAHSFSPSQTGSYRAGCHGRFMKLMMSQLFCSFILVRGVKQLWTRR